MSTVDAFLSELDAQNHEALERIGTRAACEPSPEITVAKLLGMALKNELEATECAAAWIASTPEVDVKLALARQAGDEAKHYKLIVARLARRGVGAPKMKPQAPSSPRARHPPPHFVAGLHGHVARD